VRTTHHVTRSGAPFTQPDGLQAGRRLVQTLGRTNCQSIDGFIAQALFEVQVKPIHLFIASFIMLGFAGLSFNWSAPNRPLLIEILGGIGVFVWLPLLIVAIIWTRVASGRERSSSSSNSEAEALKPALANIPTRQPRTARGKPRLITPPRLFLIGIAAAACAGTVLEFGPSDPSDLQIALLAISATTALVATFSSIVWAIFRWRLGQG
jgi:hypothetical protein